MKQQDPDAGSSHVIVNRSENCLSQKVPKVILGTLSPHMNMHDVGFNDMRFCVSVTFL